MLLSRSDYVAAIGKTDRAHDVVTEAPVRALWAALDRPGPAPVVGDALPPGWHVLYFWPTYRPKELRPDGSPRASGVLPEVPLPRRMFGGLRLRLFRPIRIGDPIERISTLQDLQFKRGSAGTMCVASVVHNITSGGDLALEETWTTLFLPGRPVNADTAAGGAKPKPGRTIAEVGRWTRLIHPDPVLLFRYSALTFNSHLIHFDTRHALEKEGYPALLVQGPLLANLLLDFACEHNPDRAVVSYSMRAVAPLFASAPFRISALPISHTACAVWATGPDGETASSAEVTFA